MLTNSLFMVAPAVVRGVCCNAIASHARVSLLLMHACSGTCHTNSTYYVWISCHVRICGKLTLLREHRAICHCV